MAPHAVQEKLKKVSDEVLLKARAAAVTAGKKKAVKWIDAEIERRQRS